MSSHCFSPAHHLRVSQEAGGRLCAGATAHSAPTREQMLEGTLDLERSASVCLPAPLRGLRRVLGPFPPRAQEGPWQEGILPVGPPCRAVGPQVGGRPGRSGRLVDDLGKRWPRRLGIGGPGRLAGQREREGPGSWTC